MENEFVFVRIAINKKSAIHLFVRASRLRPTRTLYAYNHHRIGATRIGKALADKGRFPFFSGLQTDHFWRESAINPRNPRDVH